MPSKRSTTPVLCQQCHTPFFPFVNAPGKFCSQRCAGASRRRPLADRLWEQIAKTDGCWLHQGSKNSQGYGRVHRDGRMVLAHRVVWELTYGPIPDGLWVLHACDTPACCRPDHLFLGTHSDNMRDMATKGRQNFQRYPELLQGERHWSRRHPEAVVRGERHGQAKLTADVVRAIRQHHAGGATIGATAARFGVSRSQTSRIVRGESWQHVTG